MSITARMAALKAAPARPSYPRWLTAGATNERWHIPELDAADKQASVYEHLSWLQSAVTLLAETAAVAAFSVQRRGGGEGLQPISNHPFELLLEDPNPLHTQFELLVATFASLKVFGNCYWWLNRPSESEPPTEIFVIPTHQIQPAPDGRMFLRGYTYDAGDGQPIPLETWEVCHFRNWNPRSKYVGLSPVIALGVVAMGDIAAQRYRTNFFGKDNAKADGILTFKDWIDDGKWNRLQADWKEQHGGTQNKRLMMLRGAGDVVNYIPTAMSSADMEFLASRRFTMEEVYNLVAPGLASVLAVNATEANSDAGKDTLFSMGIYPMHQAVSKRITKSVLPAYGAGLVGAFEDVRRADTQIELLEIAEYAKYHTVDEVRAKYYGDAPLAPDARTVAQGPTPPAPQPAPAAPPDPAALLKAEDRRRWQVKITKAMANGRPPEDVAFDPDYLSDGEAMTIRAALTRARSADDVRRAFEGE